MASQTTSRASRRVNRNTGFPEPFDQCKQTKPFLCQGSPVFGHRFINILLFQVSNTTLPHPDADLSPNACISHDDLAGDHALKRKRLSFLHRHKNRRTLMHGLIGTQSELVSSVLSLSLSRSSSSLQVGEAAPKLTSPSIASFQSKSGSESAESTKKEDETPPSSPDSIGHSPKKTHRFSKWRRSRGEERD